MIRAIGLGKNLLLLLLVRLVAEGKLLSEDGWKIGRVTYYGENGSGGDDGFSIHYGSCQFGQLDPDVGTGWDVAAMSDAHPDFQGSCGKCYEMACSPMEFRDNYGGSVNRMSSCRDESKSLIVTIVDSCPCIYSKNAYNNKRWCCGDMDHFDLSAFAFNKLAPMMHGVIGIKYRPVPCPSYEDVMPTTPKIILPPMPISDEDTTEGPRDTILTGSSPAKKTSPVKVTVPTAAVEVEEEPTEPEAVPPAVRALPLAVPTPPFLLPGLRPSVSARTPAVPTLPSTIESRPPSMFRVPAQPTELRIEQMSRPPSPIFMAIPAPSPEEEINVDLASGGDVEYQLALDVDMDQSGTEEATVDAVPPASSITVTSMSAATSRSGVTARSTVVGSLVPGDVPGTPLREGPDEPEVVIERVSRVSSSDTTPTTGFEYSVFHTPSESMSPPILSPQTASPSADSGMRQIVPTPTIIGAGSSTSKASSPLPSAEWDVVKCSREQEKLQIYDGGFHECFTDGGLLRYEDSNTMGMDGSPAWCTTVEPGRSIAAISVGRGMYKGKNEISFRIMAGDERPEVSVALVGTKGPCPQIHLNNMVCTKPHMGYRTFYMPLSSLTSATSEEFEGCGSNEAEDIYAIAFKSEQEDNDLKICIDYIELY